MSKECCGDDEQLEVSPAPVVIEEDACCGPREVPVQSVQWEEIGPWWRDRSLILPVVSGVLLLVGYLLEWTGFVLPAMVVHSLALAAGAWTFVPGAVRRLARGKVGVGLLMTIAAVGAVVLGHVGEAAALAFLFAIAETLEERALVRAKTGLRSLLALIPQVARVSRSTGEVTVPAAEVKVGDILVVGAGDRVATDGVVVMGQSFIDTSAVTGESIPVQVGRGDQIPAGVVNGSGRLEIEAVAAGSDNSLTTIVQLVEQAHRAKGERARLADRIARPLVPAVLVIAGLVALYGVLIGDPETWIERALVVLVAASPCALAIAVPVTVISAIGSASKFGIIIKSGAAFEQLGTIRQVAFDKTGTLTQNRPSVVDVVTDGRHRHEILSLAAAVESGSSHPLGLAIISAADDGVTPATDVTEDAGHGVSGDVAGAMVRVGNVRWIDPGALTGRAVQMANAGMSTVVVEIDGHVAGVIGIRDELRPEARATVQALSDQGINTTMLTGDNARTAAGIASQAGIVNVRAELLPTDKSDAIATMVEEKPTAMIGDGINDAPALATATVGIAMGVTGSAAAIESADVAFTGTDLRQIPRALQHARRGRKIMTGNIVLALAIIVGLFPLALFGVLGLTAVVLVHEIAEVVVIGNGIRAARARMTALPALPDQTHTLTPVGTTHRIREPLQVLNRNGSSGCGCCDIGANSGAALGRQ